MYPCSEEFLTVSQAVEHWARSGPDRPDPEELLSELLRAFWRDDLRLLQPGGTGTASRETFLTGLHSLADTAGIIFVGSEADVPLDVSHQPDGSVIVHIAYYVVLPSDLRRLERETLERAYEALAEVPTSEYPPEFLTIFRCHMIQREDFGCLCDIRGWRRPSFWFRSAAARATTTDRRQDTRRCREWLTQVFVGERRSRSSLLREATKRFRALQPADFQSLWEELAPFPWRQPGAISKKNKRTGSPT